MPERLLRLVYRSAVAHQPDVLRLRGDVRAILGAARRRNARMGVTGLLLHTGTVFLQVLEGPQRAVQEIFGIVMADPRHHTIAVIEMTFPERRRFPDWAMGYLGAAPDPQEPGLSPSLSPSLSLGLSGEIARLDDLPVDLLQRTILSFVGRLASAGPGMSRALLG